VGRRPLGRRWGVGASCGRGWQGGRVWGRMRASIAWGSARRAYTPAAGEAVVTLCLSIAKCVRAGNAKYRGEPELLACTLAAGEF
jgi:hypothetical protein